MSYRHCICTSVEEYRGLLSRLESETSITWASGDKPTKCHFANPEPINFHLIVDEADDWFLMYNPRLDSRAKRYLLTQTGFVRFIAKHFPKE